MSIAAALLLALTGPAIVPIEQVRARAAEDEIIYFVLPDRFDNADPTNDTGGLTGDRLATGYDPTAKGFYHGGDLKGLTRRLDYIQALGVTAIWIGPIFKNKPVQGAAGQESAGYHGYWITDFTTVDPHFGTDADFATFVDAAHARGIKVYMDIIANHTADVIQYRECIGKPCAYRSTADYPYQRRGGVSGTPINPGFAGDAVQTPENFARLTDPAYAYTPFVPAAEQTVKVPAWLNDPRYYHNRGDSTFAGESARYGDFAGLDDLMTEDPRVVAGFIAIYGSWIDRFGIDGFRVDTARHVNPEFWQAFVPAMQTRAAARGIPNFPIFGEVYSETVDPGYTAQYTRRDGFPEILDFSFQAAARAMLSGKAGTDLFAKLIDGDVLYGGGDATAQRLPTFLGNHDMGRIGHMLDLAWPNATEAERLQRLTLAHVLLLSARGVPTIYSGDEQGFTGHGGDQDAREDLFASHVASYNDNRLIGTATTTATAHFGTENPIFQTIAKLAQIRRDHAQLRHGRTVVRAASDKPGLLAFTRGADDGHEILVALNTSNRPVSANVEIGARSAGFTTLAGACPARAAAPGSISITLPPLGYAICAALPSE
ncbi:glycosidase [Sphingomonas sp. BE270]|jgi:glycosidase|uniref:alpha-amylase family glycosyl hydrolase n=1 Tax=unclassified Sphingomonas TaxID=196159 RepID=UPI00053E5407|nr:MULTISPECIES: alpha-amylase family glycosyl hydrolase [unclassified Sphingomonas]MDR6847773.1 glycosidase [Sphingomonas sp. BE137]MDR7259183.1 glycosidase [Sphingomonas sp. BE270]